eukprot:1161582-Pelagomonas_calceolata.AAC.2
MATAARSDKAHGNSSKECHKTAQDKSKAGSVTEHISYKRVLDSWNASCDYPCSVAAPSRVGKCLPCRAVTPGEGAARNTAPA